MQQEYMLEFKNITKAFPGVIALKNVSLGIKRGEILSAMGENGAGKSTLMKILSGVYAHSSFEGQLFVNGIERKFNIPRDSERVCIQMIYQEVSLIEDMSVAENIFVGRFPSAAGYINQQEMNQQAARLLQTIGLDVSPREKIRWLSTSQQQMVSIAKAISKDPGILVLDEPTSTLTSKEADMLFDVIRNLKSRGISCIYISHKIKEILEISDRVCVMRNGEVVDLDAIENFTEDRLIEKMIGREHKGTSKTESSRAEEEVFRLENLTVKHRFIPGVNVVDNISFSLHRGEVLGLAGLVGSGRSEIVGSIFGLLPKEAGSSMFMKGKQVIITKPLQAIRNGITLVTEDRRKNGFISALSIRENVTLVSLQQLFRSGFISIRKERSFAEEYTERLAIKAPSLETRVRNLSGGNQQKVVLCKWLVRFPKVLLLDEPTRGIDVGAKHEIYDIIKNLARQGVAIIFISSEFPELLMNCDRILVIKDGKMVAEVPAEKATEMSLMARAAMSDEKSG